MLPPRPLSNEPRPAPQIIERPVDDGRLWELQERVVRIETDRRWLNTSLFVVLIGAGILAPAIGIWTSERRADQYEEETSRIEHRVTELDRDVGELLTAVLSLAEERAEDARASAARDVAPRAAAPRAAAPRVARPRPSEKRARVAQNRGPAAPRGSQGRVSPGSTNAQEWAETFGGRVLHGSLDQAERNALRSQWHELDASLQTEILTALLKRYGMDPDTFRAAMQEPTP